MSLFLHDVTHLAMTAPGWRPRPVAAFSPELRPVPVMLMLFRPGEDVPFAVVPAEAQALHPPRGGGPATYVLTATVPEDLAHETERGGTDRAALPADGGDEGGGGRAGLGGGGGPPDPGGPAGLEARDGTGQGGAGGGGPAPVADPPEEAATRAKAFDGSTPLTRTWAG